MNSISKSKLGFLNLALVLFFLLHFIETNAQEGEFIKIENFIYNTDRLKKNDKGFIIQQVDRSLNDRIEFFIEETFLGIVESSKNIIWQSYHTTTNPILKSHHITFTVRVSLLNKNQNNELGGYVVLNNKKNSLIMDVGSSPNNKLSSNYQAGALSFEIVSNGKKLISNFIFLICKIKRNWSSKDQKIQLIKEVKDQVGSEKVICALSGGVDSSVVAQLLNKAIGKKLYCIFVNTGLLRKNEEVQVVQTFKKRLKMNLIYVNAEKEFLKKLNNVSDPEKKRKIIGNLFIKIFERYAKKIKNVKFLAQGTLYPDLIESKSVTGSQTSKIKSHHNVGGLPKKMKLKLVEPLKFLFKDEVRKLGLELNLSKDIISRHPFPGPGLAIRMPGLITNDKIKILKEADYYFIQALKDHGLYHKIWQAYAALLPVKTVGVMGDNRTYEYLCLLRAITSEDGMTADFYEFKKSFMETISNQIVNSIRGINRVVYDITSKPPSTIELE